jgi:hypothetical protein
MLKGKKQAKKDRAKVKLEEAVEAVITPPTPISPPAEEESDDGSEDLSEESGYHR